MRRLRSIAILLLSLVAIAAPVRASEVGDLVQRLGADDFDQKARAIKELGALGDPRAVRVLKALKAESLFTLAPAGNSEEPSDAGAAGDNADQSGTQGDSASTASDAADSTDGTATEAQATASPVQSPSRVVIARPNGDKCDIFDPVEDTKIGTASCDSLDQIVVNNYLRGLLDAAVGNLTLVGGSAADRLAAATDAFKHPTPANLPELEKARAAETDSQVRHALDFAIAAARLTGDDKAAQLAAVSVLSSTPNPEVFNLLSTVRNRAGLDPEAQRALDAALHSVSRRLRLVGIAATLFEGLSLGSVLLLAAIGLAVTFGLMGVINMAHGEMIMLGAYSAYVVQEAFRAFLPPSVIGAYLVVSVPVAFLVAGGVGVALERGIIRFLYGRPLETMLATWGISLMLQQLVRSIFGAPNKEVANPAWMTGGVELIGGFTVTWNRVYIVAFCFLIMAVLALVLRRSAYGLHVRAVTQNRAMASVMGIPTARIDALTFGLGSGIAGMAGVALSQIGNVSPNLGQIYIVDSFLVVVFGGVGSLMGTLAGALGLGIANKLLEPVAGAILGKVFVLVVIILFIQKRPRGLFALKGRAAEI